MGRQAGSGNLLHSTGICTLWWPSRVGWGWVWARSKREGSWSTLSFSKNSCWLKSWLSLPTETECKNAETEFGGKRKVTLILSQWRGAQSRFMPQELCPPCMSSLGAHIRWGLTVRSQWRGTTMLRPLFLPLALFQRLVSVTPSIWVWYFGGFAALLLICNSKRKGVARVNPR